MKGELNRPRLPPGDFRLSCQNSFHGKTLGALSVTGREKYWMTFAPLIPDCHVVPYGSLEALEAVLREKTCAAFIVEPVQGEGGIFCRPKATFPAPGRSVLGTARCYL